MIRKLFILPLIFTILCIALTPTVAEAAKFSSLYVKLNNDGANQSVDATVCANPSSPSSGTENKVTIIFPNEFTVSQSFANWVTDTTNLPTGAIAWPGISANASSVSGQSITFSSSDLTSNSLYCFNLTSSASNTGTAKTDEYGQVTTLDSSNAVIDQTTYSVSVLTSNQVSVTAVVGPQVEDLPLSITSDNGGYEVAQNSSVKYTINYGLLIFDPAPIKIQAQWTQGTVEGSSIPSIEIVQYDSGTAINAYNNTPPVIDTVNRTITWDITSFPGKTTNNTVSFRLKTNNNYTGSKNVYFDVSARVISGPTVTPDHTLNMFYHYSTATSSQSSTSTTTSTTSSPTSTTTQQAALNFSNINVYSLSQSSAQIAVSTNNNALLTFKYGSSANSLTNTIKTLESTSGNLISLDKLDPDTQYYFRVGATDKNGKTIISNIYIFRTAVISPIPSISKSGLIAISQNNILLNSAAPNEANTQNNTIIVPTDTNFTIQFYLDKPVLLKTIQAIIRNKNVLGISNLNFQEGGSDYINLVEVQPNTYTGKLINSAVGNYEIYVRMIDYNGNILEQKLSNLIVTPKFSVNDSKTKSPIENARVLLYLYNQTSKTYSPISPEILPINNPQLTNPNGTLNLTLPYGIFRADISALGYKSKSIDFEVDPGSNDYPTVYLEPQSFNIFNVTDYYTQIITDMFSASQNYMRLHADSSRLFNLITNGSLLIFVLITFIAFYAKTHVSLWNVPMFVKYKLKILLKKDKSLLIIGKVIDELTELPISKANVYLENPNMGHVEVNLKTNKLGEFYYQEKKDRKYKISVIKKGYIVPEAIFHQSDSKQHELLITMKKSVEEKYGIIDTIFVYAEDLLGTFLEFLIILGFVFELYFVATFGFLRTAPFMIISLSTFFLLIIYVYNPKGIRRG